MSDARRDAALEVESVGHTYGNVCALQDVSLRVAAGTVLALVGESGSGKTTLLRCFNRMVDPARGTVRVEGADVRALDPVALRRRVGYVPQTGGLLPHWTALQNAALVPRLVGMPDVAGVAAAALAQVGLEPAEFGGRLPHELSGGQRQRVALARALAARQAVILLDEPFGALDAISRGEVQEVFERARRDLGFTAVLVTHDLATAARLADTIVVMRAGRIEGTGSVAELRGGTEYVRMLLARAEAAGAALRAP